MPLPARVTRMISSLSTDLEKGHHQPQNVERVMSPLPVIDREAEIQAALNEFRFAVGIHNSADMSNDRAIPNIGTYQRVCKMENKYKKQFHWFSWIINSVLGLQLIFAAALTALGAGNGPRSAVTALGSMNTVIAGFLTYLKGSGLPNRLKYYKDEVTKVREYIEHRERELSGGAPGFDLRQEVAMIEDMYESLKRDIEVNTPDAYISRAKEQSHVQQLDIGRYASGARRELDNRIYDVTEKYSVGRRGLESRISQSRMGTESALRDVRSGIDDRLNSARQGLSSQFSQGRLDAEARLRDTKADLDDRYGRTRHDVNDQYDRTRHDMDDRLEGTRQDLSDRYESTRHDLDDRLTRERSGLETRLNETRGNLDAQLSATRSGVENQFDATRVATAAQVENTRHGLETRIEDTRAGIASQVEDTRHGMEARMKEMQAQVKEQEDKIMGIAEKVASKVLAVAQKRHDDDHK